MKPLLKGGGKFAQTVVSYRTRGGALSAVTGREYAEVGTYMIGRELLTKPVIKGQVKGAVASHSAGYVYDYFRQSSGSSSESYQQNGGPGGNSYPIPSHKWKGGHTQWYRGVTNEWLSNPCKKGYGPRKIKGRWMCVPIRSGKWSKHFW